MERSLIIHRNMHNTYDNVRFYNYADDFYNIPMTDEVDISAHINRCNTAVNKLGSIVDSLDLKFKVQKSQIMAVSRHRLT